MRGLFLLNCLTGLLSGGMLTHVEIWCFVVQVTINDLNTYYTV